MIDEKHVITDDWTRKVNVMSDAPLDGHPLMFRNRVISKRAWQADGLYHLEIEFSVNEPVRGFVYMDEYKDKNAVLWAVNKGERVSNGIGTASRGFLKWFDRQPEFAYVWKLPGGVDEGTVMNVDDFSVYVFSADWVHKGFIVIL